jgi:hypothetical protein
LLRIFWKARCCWTRDKGTWKWRAAMTEKKLRHISGWKYWPVISSPRELNRILLHQKSQRLWTLCPQVSEFSFMADTIGCLYPITSIC